jgi:protein-disulfide isomerase
VLNITRRDFAIGAGALALAGAALSAGLALFRAGLPGPALAQATMKEPTPAELMEPGPLADIWLGDEKAPVTIIEYASMTCPHCAHFSETTFPELKKRYIDTGKVRFVFREFPLDPLAMAAIMLARCAGKDKYYPLVETLFHQQKDWVMQRPLPPLLAIAKQAGFTEQSFEACLNDRKLQSSIETTRQTAAEKFGVNSTPTFFINGKIQRGGFGVEDFDKLIEPHLKGG